MRRSCCARQRLERETASRYAIRSPRRSCCKPISTPMSLPDAEVVLGALAEKMHALAFDAKLVGIYSGGAWLAERLAAMLPGGHAVGYIDVSFYRDDYAERGLRANPATTALPFEVDGTRIVL